MNISIKQSDLDYTVYTGGEISTLFDITDQDIIRLYYFFKHNSNTESYVIADDSDVVRGTSFITVDNYSLYYSYRITFVGENVASLDSKTLYIVSAADIQDELSFKRYLEKNDVKNSINSTFIIEKDYNIVSNTERMRDHAIIEQHCNLCVVLNPKYSEKSKEFLTSSQKLHKLAASSYKKFITCDVTDLIKNRDIQDSTSMTLQKSVAIIEDIDKRIHSIAQNNHTSTDNIILYVDDALTKNVMYVYVGIAAYLTMSRGYHCFVNDDYKVAFMDILRKSTSPVYNYLSDYLKIISNFPTFSLSISDDLACLCIKDLALLAEDRERKISQRRYKLTLSIYVAPFDITSFSLRGVMSKNVSILDYNLIEVLDFRDYLDLESRDLEVCTNQYSILNNLVREIDGQLRDGSSLLCEKTLNCNNLLLFRQDDRYYIGYVSNIEYKLPFVMKPFANNYSTIREVLTIQDLNRLYDTNVIFDADLLVNRIIASNQAYDVNKHFNLNKTALKGCILQGTKGIKEKLLNLDALNFSEIGIWSWQTSSLRDSHVGAIAKKMNLRALLEKDYLGYFGGMHPAEKITMEISPELWR